ncbi:bacteriocin immunity protein [Pseudomonas sp. L13]|uniref:bacteriocin immunity protein n=1 Tax=Pseudomonas sp. L13 TaxID=343985 RepID=UPI00137B1747|nr:bacteriocin immunity protein [Pseudomonas sp. L13]NCE89789.1 bacteriocin immunity protein [Pseudomonas sp. L13]
MNLKSALVDYTEHEFEALIAAIDDAKTEEERGELVEHFNKLVPHPAGSDLLFYPEDGADDSPNGVIQSIKNYCLSMGLPSFKDT